MFSSPEKRIKKESNSIKSKKDSSERNSFENNKNIASKNLQVLQEKSDDHLASKNLTDLQEKANQDDTGLPAQLKQGVESLSGVSLDDVKVNYNSDKPSNLGAKAYAQGNEIHIGGGQEKHLAHEAWHVVQQKQGRVSSTRKESGTLINDDVSLESEATKMGDKAMNSRIIQEDQTSMVSSITPSSNVAQLAGDQQVKKKGFFGKAWDSVKSGASSVGDAVKSGASSAGDAVKEKWNDSTTGEKVGMGVSAAGAVTSATKFGMENTGGLVAKDNLLGLGLEKTAMGSAENAAKSTVAKSVGGIGGIVTGTYKAVKGGADFMDSRDSIEGLKKELEDAKKNNDVDAQIKLRTKIQLEKDRKSDAAVSGVAGTLSAAGGAATVSGVGAPVGAALGMAATGLSLGNSAKNAARQSHRDRSARRLRNDSEIIDDKSKKNQERVAKEEGASYDPRNWGAKINKKLGRNQTGENAIGVEGLKKSDDQILARKKGKNQARVIKEGGSAFNPLNWGAKINKKLGRNQSGTNSIGIDPFTKGANEEYLNKKSQQGYLNRKEDKYKKEGWDRTKKDGKVTGAKKGWASGLSRLDPRNLFKKDEMNNVDIGVAKNLSSSKKDEFVKENREAMKERKKEKGLFGKLF